MISGETSYQIEGDLMQKLKERFGGKNRVLVGVPKGAGSYEDGTLIAVVAAANEFGATINHPNGAKIVIPERPALRDGSRAAMPEIKQLSIIGVRRINQGDMLMEQLVNQIGLLSVGKIQETISNGVGPANAQSTIKKKGSSTPLIDTGHYRQSIRHVVINEDEEVQLGL